MRRLFLLAIGLSALLWAVAARTAPTPATDITKMSGVESRTLTGDAPGPIDPDQLWRAQHAVTPTTESAWKSAPVHAALAAMRSTYTFDTVVTVSSPDPPVAAALPYLRHTPLLI